MNSLPASAQKQAICQLVVALGSTISNKQRQALIEIYIALDNACRAQTHCALPSASGKAAVEVSYGH